MGRIMGHGGEHVKRPVFPRDRGDSECQGHGGKIAGWAIVFFISKKQEKG